ncbi:GspE/PulE family protein [Engelhardtia mirabilis]|uniref:Type II/IV secretion system protein n=1 Tax=Engelhardtia mirabilis TaxID=2528011 RepID=A0A518BJ53_9BACT|nr:Type II/IV secretion system protein [Planctomycetes bacterium Pla133]QDV01331.1 Type II/IV secretion system protein [Planctomycetes bacterium Pla86]
MTDRLGELLVAAGVIDERQLREAQAHQRGSGDLGQALLDLGFVDEVQLGRARAKEQGLPFVDLTRGRVPDALLEMVPADVAREYLLVPVAERDGTLIVAIDDPLRRFVADQLQFQLGRNVACALAAPSALRAAVTEYYGAPDAAPDPAAELAKQAGSGDEADAPVVRLVTRTFADALAMRASDIHFEPFHDTLRVRFRIDGVLRVVAEHPGHLAAPLLTRLKVMGSLDIAERRKPQDGRIALKVGGREIDVRAAILPSNHGETIVMRLLDRSANLISLAELGFEGDDHVWFKRLISRPNGIVLVTGPTGSGKTTTLYGALAELNRPDVKIITAEDPVEYHISGINQVQVNNKVGLNFARILKAMLRAAPNVILVGEIRDLETAETAIQAALTGHLVFSTLHTNDAVSALTRLVDMGVQPFMASAAVQGVVAQRLVRRLCNQCREAYTPDGEEVAMLGLDPSSAAGSTFYRARGCRACEGAGYRGRVGLFELFELDADLRELVYRGASLDALRAAGRSSGRLREIIVDGARKVVDGHTTVDEVLRVTRAATDHLMNKSV